MKAGEVYQHPRYIDGSGNRLLVRITKVRRDLKVVYYRTVSSDPLFDGARGRTSLERAETWVRPDELLDFNEDKARHDAFEDAMALAPGGGDSDADSQDGGEGDGR